MSASLIFRDAIEDDAEAIAEIHNAVAATLTERFGKGHWSHHSTGRGVVSSFRYARVRVGVSRGRIATVLRLAKKKPWAIDVRFFTPVKQPLYLTGMAVDVRHQQGGLGRKALDDATATAVSWPADAIRLDAYDGEVGAGSFYEKCGYTHRGRVVYRSTPLVYYEMVFPDRTG